VRRFIVGHGSEGHIEDTSQVSTLQVLLESNEAMQWTLLRQKDTVCFTIRPEFVPEEQVSRKMSNRSVNELQFAEQVSVMSVSPEDDTCKPQVELDNNFLSKFISFPGSRNRLCWDLLGAFLIFYDLILIPLQAFSPPGSGFLRGMDWFTLIYWTVNIFASVQVGYISRGVTVMVPKRILMHYLKTWCLIDAVVVIPDWIFTLRNTSSGESTGNQIKLLRMTRLPLHATCATPQARMAPPEHHRPIGLRVRRDHVQHR
jgi:hypothetical protein